MTAGAAVLGRQAGIIRLLEPKWRSALARVRREQAASLPRLLLLGVLGLAFWAAAFGILYKVLSYFRGVEEIGSLLGGQFRMDREQGHGVPLGHFGQDIEE